MKWIIYVGLAVAAICFLGLWYLLARGAKEHATEAEDEHASNGGIGA